MAEHFIPDIFLEYPDAKGEATQKPYTDSIAVYSYTFSVNAVSSLNHSQGQMGGIGTMSPVHLELVHDKGYAKMRKQAGQGKIATSETKSRVWQTANSKNALLLQMPKS